MGNMINFITCPFSVRINQIRMKSKVILPMPFPWLFPLPKKISYKAISVTVGFGPNSTILPKYVLGVVQCLQGFNIRVCVWEREKETEKVSVSIYVCLVCGYLCVWLRVCVDNYFCPVSLVVQRFWRVPENNFAKHLTGTFLSCFS